MREKLIHRVSRIISGSVHSLIDSIEGAASDSVLSEAIREIESAINEVKTELGQVVAKKHLANSKLMEENKKHEDLGEKIELAITENRDDLAETAIARQFDIEAQIPILEATISDCKGQEKELESYINALQAKKREMKEELIQFRNAMAKNETTEKSGGSAASNKTVESRVSQAQSTFERVIEKSTGIPGKNMISDKKTDSQLAELDEIARKNRIRERLSAIKREVNSK